MIEQLEKVLNSIEYELSKDDSLWDKKQLNNIVKPEILELYKYFSKGKKFFKYGKKQRMLVSTYLLTDSLTCLGQTTLGKEIIKLQNIYDSI